MRTIDDYLALITWPHSGKPNFVAFVRAMLEGQIACQELLQSIAECFDLDKAVGAQLDAVGLWVGFGRYIKTPLPNVWFSFDIADVGFDEGIWLGPHDTTDGLTRLDDDTYRMFLRLKIGANHWDGSNQMLGEILGSIFDGVHVPGTYVFPIDGQDMSMTIVASGKILPALYKSLLEGGYFPLKPGGVRVNYKQNSIDNTPVFGFDVNNEKVGGFDVGSWGVDL